MNHPSPRPRELERLIDAALNDSISRDELHRLGDLLRSDERARQQFLESSALEADLHFSVRLARADAEAKACVADEPATLSNSPAAFSDAHRSPRAMSLMQRASRRPKGPSIAVAAAVMVALLLGMGVTPVRDWIAGGSDKNELRATARSGHVAKLSNWHDAVWLEGTRPPLRDPRLKVGKRLLLASGVIEIKYETGARVVLEGPVEFVIGSRESGVRGQGSRIRGQGSADHSRGPTGRGEPANSGFLKLGKLVARVADKKAKGFFIDIPNARIEDLGTEFGIDVQKSGLAEVVVLTGEVDLVRNLEDGAVVQRVRLGKDQGAVIAADGGEITMRKKVDPRLIAAFRRRLDTSVADAAAISGYGVAIANPSFETPRLGGAAYAAGAMDEWTATGSAIGRQTTESAFSAIDAREVGAHGRQYAFVQGSGTLTSHSSTRVIDGATYLLTVALGNRFVLDPDRYVIRLLVDGQEVAASDVIDGTTINEGRFKDFSIQYVGDTTDGGAVTVQLEHRARDQKRTLQGVFDKIRVVVMLPTTKTVEEDRP